jgi:hypothetical protein
MAERYGADTPVLEWRERLGLFPVRQPQRHSGDRDRAAVTQAPPYPNLPADRCRWASDPPRPIRRKLRRLLFLEKMVGKGKQ